MLDTAMTQQLQQYLALLREPITLVASLGDDKRSADTRALLTEIAALSDKVSASFDGVDQRMLQVRRVGTGDLDAAAVGWVGEGQRAGVQPLAFQPQHHRVVGTGRMADDHLRRHMQCIQQRGQARVARLDHFGKGTTHVNHEEFTCLFGQGRDVLIG
mgnify:CR=1 FL=1